MVRLLKRLLMLAGLAAVLWLGAHAYAGWRIRSALVEGGMNARAATCMAHRLTRRLSLWQLHKLEAFQEERPTIGGLVRAAKRIDDRKVILVTSSSALLCTTGLAH